MEYIYSALLLHEAGKQIAEDSVKKVLESVGIQPNDAKIKALVASLDGVDIAKAIVEQATLQMVAAPAQGVSGKTEDKKEEPKKAEDEKKQEESASAGLSALFG